MGFLIYKQLWVSFTNSFFKRFCTKKYFHKKIFAMLFTAKEMSEFDIHI